MTILVILCAVLMTACSEESPIEGLMETKPSVTAVHAEVPAGSNNTIMLTVNNQTLNLEVKNTNTTANGFETRHCTITMRTSTGVFSIGANSAYILTMNAGVEISAAAFNYPSYSGALFFATRAVNTSTYNYVNTNGIHFGNSYYVPLKIMPANNQGPPIYGYLQFTVTTEKVVLDKVVYRVVGSLLAGG